MTRLKAVVSAIAAALVLLSVPIVQGTGTVAAARANPVAGEKLDSGLGELPPYRKWANHATLHALVPIKAAYHVPGEKLDSGLGELPPYREWANHPPLQAPGHTNPAYRQMSGDKPESGRGNVSVTLRSK